MSFWKGKRVFVTGHTGFKGSWLSLALISKGATVTGYALNPESSPSLFDIAKIANLMSSVIGDIRDFDKLRRVLGSARPEIVFHLAAQPLVRTSYADPLTTFATNVLGTAHLFEACRFTSSVRVALNITTDKVYENIERESLGFRETHPLGGHDPYSSSKACSEIVSQSYHRSFFVPAGRIQSATARCGNVIGGGDWAVDRIIPDIVRSWAAKKPIRVRSPNAVRPWLHVLDSIEGYLMLARRMWRRPIPKIWEPYNFAPSKKDHVPVIQVVKKLQRDLGFDLLIDRNRKLHEANLLILNASKARKQMGWAPRLRIDEALAWTASWYRSFYSGESAFSLCQKQLEEYSRLGSL